MDSYISSNNSASDGLKTPLASPSVRPVERSSFNNGQETTSLKMEKVLPDRRNDVNSYQQHYQPLPQSNMRENRQFHQNIMQQNQQLQQQNNMQQQQNLRLQLNDSVRYQTNPTSNSYALNDPVQNNQRGPRPFFETQRIQIAPEVKVAGPEQPMRPSINGPSGEISINHPNQPNYLRMEAPKIQNDRVQRNLQNNSENYNTQFSKTPMNLIRKSSDLDITSSSILNYNQKPNEAAVKSQIEMQSPNISNLTKTGSKPNLLNTQTPFLNAAETKLEPNESIILHAESDKSKNIASEKSENLNRSDTKTIGKSQKENKENKIKDSCITSGMVQKNIKFFEENDTAKKPLTPTTIMTKKKDKITNVPPGVIKSKTCIDQYESGVDETPVVHPNLGSIFQIPRKVAKISNFKSKKRSQKFKSIKRPFEEASNKKQHKLTLLNELLKPSDSCLSHKSSNRTNRKKKIYGSKEELLYFFENTKLWRKLNRQGTKMNQNAMKDRVVHKPTTNGDIPSPKKIPSKLQTPSKKNPLLSPTKLPSTPGTPGTKLLPKTPESPASETPLIKKVPMNKIQVGAAPSPNLKTVRSKIGSLANSAHKPGGGNVKIESHKIDLSKIQPKTEAKNDQYKPSGGDKKIQQVKLQWNAKSKVGSLENATYKPGGGDKKIESVKLDFKEKAKSKVGSKDNVKHVPGGGNIKIEQQKLEFKAQSKVGSLDNVKHKPGGGDIKIFDDKTYLRQVSGNNSEGRASGTQAYKALSVVKEVEERSAPETPGRKTSIKIKKTTTIENSEKSPKVKKVNEITSKKEEKDENSPTRVTVTYSKISSSKHEKPETPVKLVKIPAKNPAPVLKSNLSKKDMSDDPNTGKQDGANEIKRDLATVKGNLEQISGSSNLSKDKSVLGDDTEKFTSLESEITSMGKIEEISREKNALDDKSKLDIKSHGEQLKEFSQISSENYIFGNNHQPLRSQSSPIKNVGQADINDSLRSNFYSSQNLKPGKMSQSLSFVRNQQKPLFMSSLQEEKKLSPPQQNWPSANPQVLNSFKKLHRTRQSVFKNDKRVSELARKEINDNYRKNKNVTENNSIKDLIKIAHDLNYEMKTTVVELELMASGNYRMHIRPEMFEERDDSPKTLSK